MNGLSDGGGDTRDGAIGGVSDLIVNGDGLVEA